MEEIGQLFNFTYTQLENFILIVSRLSGLIISAPVLSNRNIPKEVKIALCGLISLLVFPFVKGLSQPLERIELLFMLMFKELAIGIFLGLVVSLIFTGLQLAGQFIDYHTGLGLVSILDPESRVQIPLAGQFLHILAMIIFLIIGGHKMLIKSLIFSFSAFPLEGFRFEPKLSLLINDVLAKVFVISFKIASPVVGAVFLSEIAYGVIARAIPQMNILIVGLPLKVIVGTIFLILSLPLFFWIINREFFRIFASIDNLFKLY
ncbi:MAG: flagellar type III secretion system protein FliR [Candidatus Omnitrophica bacterium]|nr:flagellar type III secretion system protein FliR [Candidatus Omnitrophota bacterium]